MTNKTIPRAILRAMTKAGKAKARKTLETCLTSSGGPGRSGELLGRRRKGPASVLR